MSRQEMRHLHDRPDFAFLTDIREVRERFLNSIGILPSFLYERVAEINPEA
jgi:hypothetical protein